MNIVVTFSTGFNDPVERVAHGFRALLTTILEVVDDTALADKLIEKYGARSALYLGELPSMLGTIQSVEFARPVPAAAGEGKLLANTYRELHGNELARAQWDIEESLPKSVRFGTIEVVGASICRAKETLLALVIFSDGTRGIATIPLTPENIAGILG